MASYESQEPVNPREFLRDQRAKHAHVLVHQRGRVGGRWYVVVGYDDAWDERERTHLSEEGRILRRWLCERDEAE